MGALDDEEALQWHASLMLSQVAALCELDEQAGHFPWRACATMSAPLREETLQAMQAEWRFCTGFVDKLNNSSSLYTEMAITRQQAYRDLMVKAECLSRRVNLELFGIEYG